MRATDDAEPASGGGDRGAARRLTGRALLVLGVVLLLVDLALANYVSLRHYWRWDWTEVRAFSLSARSRAELEALDIPVELTVLMSNAEPELAEVRELLDRYRAASSLLSVRYVDPDRDPAEYRVLAARFGAASTVLESGQLVADAAIVATSRDRTWTVTRDDLVGLDLDSLQTEEAKVDVRAESAITSAILAVTEGDRSRVCLATGHGEAALDTGARNLQVFREELRRDNIDVEAVSLGLDARVPADCDALWSVGPTRAFAAAEVQALADFVRGGGRLLLALDPVIDRDQVAATGLEAWLSELGVELPRAVVVERENLIPPGDPLGPWVVAAFDPHDVTRTLARVDGALVATLARPIVVRAGSAAHALFRASASSFGVSRVPGVVTALEDAPRALAGPVALAAAIEVPRERPGDRDGGASEASAKAGRVVVLGDADMLGSDTLGDRRFDHLVLADSLTGWLIDRPALIELPPKKVDARPMRLTEADLGGILLRVIGAMPLAMILLGVAVHWARRA